MTISRHEVTIDMPAYAEVLQLRERAYATIGKRLPPTDHDDTAARILLVRDGARAVASVRVTLDPTPSNCLFLREASWREALPPMDACIAGARLCVDPAARGRGLFELLHAAVLGYARDTKRRYVIGGADSVMAERYRRLGWNVTDTQYASTLEPSSKNVLMYLDVDDIDSERR